MEKNHILLIIASVIVLVVSVSGNFFETSTGKATTNIVDCVDSDGGINANLKGHVIGSFNPQTPGRDFCVDATTVGEYYCDKAISDGKLKHVFCDNGCKDSACAGDVKVDKICGQGCNYNGECVVVGTRVEGRYCDFTKVLRGQKEGSCDNNYECKSNLCLSGECLSEEGGRNFLKDVEQTYFWE
jgi:hypothetical protein